MPECKHATVVEEAAFPSAACVTCRRTAPARGRVRRSCQQQSRSYALHRNQLHADALTIWCLRHSNPALSCMRISQRNAEQAVAGQLSVRSRKLANCMHYVKQLPAHLLRTLCHESAQYDGCMRISPLAIVSCRIQWHRSSCDAAHSCDSLHAATSTAAINLAALCHARCGSDKSPKCCGVGTVTLAPLDCWASAGER